MRLVVLREDKTRAVAGGDAAFDGPMAQGVASCGFNVPRNPAAWTAIAASRRGTVMKCPRSAWNACLLLLLFGALACLFGCGGRSSASQGKALASLAVTPADPRISKGMAKQFTAPGISWEGSWISSHLGAATKRNAAVEKGTSFRWPVDGSISESNPSATGNDYSTYDPNDPILGEYHTGIDMCPPAGCMVGQPVYASADGVVQSVFAVSDPAQTLCDGSSASFLPSNGNSNLGNAVIIAHPNGKFTVYGHLDCVWLGISAGVQVSGGERIANLGHSCFGLRQCQFMPHVHFEVKDRGVLGDPTAKGYSGYTPDLPDGYGYHDPRLYLFPFSAKSISPIALRIVASPTLPVRSGPDTSYAFLTSVASRQESVAFATSGSWYQIYLPNVNGPASGWIQGDSGRASPDETATQIQVAGAGSAGLLIRPGPSADTKSVHWDQTFLNCAPALKIWDGQRFVTSANQSGWYQFYLPVNYSFSSSGSCEEPTAPGPSFGWSSGASLNVFPHPPRLGGH
jgi:murein DD-endopeptidase MepM/ murein hydrolase activator NlpD